MENKLQITNISGVDCYEKDGMAYLKLEAVARGLGFTDNSKGVEYVRWNTVKQYLADIGFSQEVAKTDYIPENVFYHLAMKAKNETAERFQALVADEITSTIRKTGGYVQAGREEEFIERYFPAFSDETKLTMVKDLRTQVLALKADNAKQQINTCSAVWTLPLHWGMQSPETRSPPITGAPKVTNKGQIYFVNKFLKEDKHEVSSR